MAQVMDKLTQLGRDDGNFKVTRGRLRRHQADDGPGARRQNPMVWTRKGSVFFISTGAERAEGRVVQHLGP